MPRLHVAENALALDWHFGWVSDSRLEIISLQNFEDISPLFCGFQTVKKTEAIHIPNLLYDFFFLFRGEDLLFVSAFGTSNSMHLGVGIFSAVGLGMWWAFVLLLLLV